MGPEIIGTMDFGSVLFKKNLLFLGECVATYR